MTKNRVCLFFYVNGQFLLHGCELDKAEIYGDYLIYPGSHYEIWERNYVHKYGVDFDYYPRGRVAFHMREQRFHILYDRCIEKAIRFFDAIEYQGQGILGLDEHYQCHKCNKDYVK